MLPIPADSHPWKRLFASTIIDTSEFLNFTISRRRSDCHWWKSCPSPCWRAHLEPLNLLNLRSRNLSCDKHNTTSRNFSTKQLLLRSNSNRSFSLSNLCGTVPQKRLVLMWRSTSSVSKLGSFDRYPTMSPWLRSILTTEEGSMIFFLISHAAFEENKFLNIAKCKMPNTHKTLSVVVVESWFPLIVGIDLRKMQRKGWIKVSVVYF